MYFKVIFTIAGKNILWQISYKHVIKRILHGVNNYSNDSSVRNNFFQRCRRLYTFNLFVYSYKTYKRRDWDFDVPNKR